VEPRRNVIAIAAGMTMGLDAGDNTLAVLMTRGLAEIGRIAAACGGDPLTCMGLAGMGDLVVTCTSRHSRNRAFGIAFASGESLASYEQRTGMVVEGAQAAPLRMGARA
jgi:glycerol-3-phosphate dehydrogenase (NAD(P)+)